MLLNISIPVCWNDLESERCPEAGVLPGIRPELVQIHQQNQLILAAKEHGSRK